MDYDTVRLVLARPTSPYKPRAGFSTAAYGYSVSDGRIVEHTW